MDSKFLLAIEASYLAGKEILAHYDTNYHIENKKDDSPVTIADKKSSEIIERILATTGVPVLSEEGKKTQYSIRKHWKEFWMVDPLDGTREFISHNGEFCVNIAYLVDNIPVFGLIYIPVSQTIYYGGSAIGKSYKYIGDYTSEIVTRSTFLKPIKTDDMYL